MKRKIKIMVVDDHSVFRKSIIMLINYIEDCEVIADFESANLYFNQMNTLKPDIIFMDIRMPGLDGLMATKMISSQDEGIKVIGISALGDWEYMNKMKQAGAKGYIEKFDDPACIENAIKIVSEGGFYFPVLNEK